MRLDFTKQVGSSMAWPLVLEGHHVLLQDNLSADNRGGLPTAWSDWAVFAYEPGEETVGVVCWSIDPSRNAACVNLAYVEPSSRQLGVFRELIKAAQEWLGKNGIDRLYLPVSDTNTVGQDAIKSCGGEPASVVYVIEMKPQPQNLSVKSALATA